MVKITIIGTSHISPEAVEKVKKTILNDRPACVAVELDPERYYALKRKAKGGSGGMGFTGMVLHFLQGSLSEKTGIVPGTEMMSAVEAGLAVGAKVVLIDKPIREIMTGIKKIPFSAKMKFLSKVVFGFMQKDKVKIDLKKVPEDKLVDQAIVYMRKEFPEFYKILIADRNKYMYNWIKKLSEEFDSIIVVVGAGHKEGLRRMLK
jgi:pheromone shutdown protein TraB